jgi:hypothetical protein
MAARPWWCVVSARSMCMCVTQQVQFCITRKSVVSTAQHLAREAGERGRNPFLAAAEQRARCGPTASTTPCG